MIVRVGRLMCRVRSGTSTPAVSATTWGDRLTDTEWGALTDEWHDVFSQPSGGRSLSEMTLPLSAYTVKLSEV